MKAVDLIALMAMLGVASCGSPDEPTPTLELSTTSHDFGEQVITRDRAPASPPARAQFELVNRGGRDSQLLQARIAGAGFAIELDTCTGAVLAPDGAPCGITLAFRPASVGDTLGSLEIVDPTGVVATAELRGTGIEDARLSVSPSPIDFGAVDRGSTHVLELVVTSTLPSRIGPLFAAIVTSTSGVDFSIAGDGCINHFLERGETCAITLKVEASGTGLRSGVLTVTDGNHVFQAPVTASSLGPLGDHCDASSQCGSGSCVDGRCCGTATCGRCEACNVDGSGTCQPVRSGVRDPRGICVDDDARCQLDRCDGAGDCINSCNSTLCEEQEDCRFVRAPVCLDQVRLRTFTAPACDGGLCTVPFDDTTCEHGCADGACVPSAAAARVCVPDRDSAAR